MNKLEVKCPYCDSIMKRLPDVIEINEQRFYCKSCKLVWYRALLVLSTLLRIMQLAGVH